MLKKKTLNNKVVFKEGYIPTFCDELKLGPNNPELSVEELNFSTFSEYQAPRDVAYGDSN